MINVQSLQKTLSNYGVVISFSGYFSQGIIEELSEAIKNHLETEKISQGDIHNVIAIFIEQTQNIINYLDENKEKEYFNNLYNSGIVAIGKNDKSYFVTSGNLVSKENIERLTARIEYLNSLEKDELKKVYKETMQKEREQNQKGAGLGHILIARKAKSKIEYSFTDYNNDLSFFSINVMA